MMVFKFLHIQNSKWAIEKAGRKNSLAGVAK